MAIDITTEKKNEILSSFIENNYFYKTSELEHVREIIIEHYHNDYELFDKISKSSKTRTLLGSRGLLHKIITEISGGRYKFRNEEYFIDILFIVRNLNKYQDTFFNKSILIVSLDFLEFSIGLIDLEIVKKNEAENFEKELNEFYVFFKRIIEKIDLEEKDETKFQSIFNTVKTYFNYNNYQYSKTWFKFYFLFYSYPKGNSARKTDVISTISTSYIRGSNAPKGLNITISETIDFKDFIALETNFLTEIFNLCKTKPLFAIEFYAVFDDIIKQEIIEFYIPINRNQTIPNLKQVLDGIEYNIPNKLQFSDKILSAAKVPAMDRERHELYNILFSSKLEEEIINSSDYSNQVVGLICNNNARLHQLGIIQFNENGNYVDKKRLKDAAIPFLMSIITNLPAYGQFFINILNLRIGIDKRHFDSELKNNTSYLAHINNYNVSSGNVNFYNAIVSKVKDETVLNINNHFIRSINYHNRYNGILKIIFENKNLLNDALHDKLSQFISNIS